MEVVAVREASSPLLVSFPHSGTAVPSAIEQQFTAAGRSLIDTDWHVPKLYDFLKELPVSTISANYSRYVIDVNRSPQGTALYPGQNETELCPTSTFGKQPIYLLGKAPDTEEIERRKQYYWRAYHQALTEQLTRIKKTHGYALLWDAHSIAAEVPRFFDGVLPDLNLGTAGGQSCDLRLSADLFAMMRSSDYSAIHNGRFKGGYITRQHGTPNSGVHAVQMEISQNTYLLTSSDYEYDSIKANQLSQLLKKMILVLLDHSPNH
jgi:N-formylglutamate deformylase